MNWREVFDKLDFRRQFKEQFNIRNVTGLPLHRNLLGKHLADLVTRHPRIGEMLSRYKLQAVHIEPGRFTQYPNYAGYYNLDRNDINLALGHVNGLGYHDNPSYIPPREGAAYSFKRGDCFNHELGHYVWFVALSDARIKKWNQLVEEKGLQWFKQKVSPYAGTDGKKVQSRLPDPNFKRFYPESFAECFAKYTNKNYRPGMLPEPIEKFMKGILTPKKYAAKSLIYLLGVR